MNPLHDPQDQYLYLLGSFYLSALKAAFLCGAVPVRKNTDAESPDLVSLLRLTFALSTTNLKLLIQCFITRASAMSRVLALLICTDSI